MNSKERTITSNYFYDVVLEGFADANCPVTTLPVSKATLVDERELIAYRIKPADKEGDELTVGLYTSHTGRVALQITNEADESAIFIGKEELILLSQVIKQALEHM